MNEEITPNQSATNEAIASEAFTKPKHSHMKITIIISALIVLLVLGVVYVFMIWQPTPKKSLTQTLQQKIVQPKEVKAADQELKQTDQTLDSDLNTSDLDQDIDTLL